ncbi:MAG: hypothetical protein JXQ76_05820 [Campylobacterales bacterium]|nr:hypothetical protein [Campylobacterales bacterium]
MAVPNLRLQYRYLILTQSIEFINHCIYLSIGCVDLGLETKEFGLVSFKEGFPIIFEVSLL